MGVGDLQQFEHLRDVVINRVRKSPQTYSFAGKELYIDSLLIEPADDRCFVNGIGEHWFDGDELQPVPVLISE